jgi:hypothetical protein
MAAVAWIVSALTSAFGFLVKHPLVTKMMFFTFFALAIHRAIGYLLTLLNQYLTEFTILNMLCYFGVIAAIQLFLSIVISGFAVKQLIAFMRS